MDGWIGGVRLAGGSPWRYDAAVGRLRRIA
jgi:hypothetical protein